MIDSLRRRYANYRYARTMRRIRSTAAALNFPLDHLSDEEIETGIYLAASRLAEGVGLSAAEASRALWLGASMAHENGQRATVDVYPKGEYIGTYAEGSSEL